MTGLQVQKHLPKALLYGLLICFAGGLNAQVELASPDYQYKTHRMHTQIGEKLLRLYDEYLEFEASGELYFKPTFELFMIRDGHVKILATAETNRTKDLTSSLQGIGMKQASAFKNKINGDLPITQIPNLFGLEGLQFVDCEYQPITKSGNVLSQGDGAIRSDDARASFSTDGTGLKVGVLSDSYNTLSGEAAAITSGDLPNDVSVLSEYSATGTDEGRAIAEILYDVAPGADIVFHTAFEGSADFAQGILDLQIDGCDIIIDDVGYFAEPMMMDGIIAHAVDSVVADGVHYFSSAGNSGAKSYEASAFDDSGFTYGGRPIHDFDSGSGVDYSLEMTIPNGVQASFSFQWDDPFGSLPNSSGTAATDMDFYLVNAGFTGILASSQDNNISGGDPYEILSYTNTSGSDETVNLMIQHYAGPEASNMKVVIWSNSVTIDEYDTESSTCVGQSNSEGAMAVGAAAYYNTPDFGVTPPVVNGFSSKGGTVIRRTRYGSVQTPVTRKKPDFSGPDGGNTTFFGTDIGNDADSDPNFFGTSASAPHVAGIASLILEEFPATTPAQMRTLLQSTAVDMGSAGFDYETGYGLVDTYEAIDQYANILAFELLDFVVQKKGKGARLDWTTVLERDNDRFVIEMTNQDFKWQEIGSVRGAGDSDAQINYNFE
ncbi:MAG: S8 family serine peptidase, partial [Bacteroidota bacterium]